jgi:hypothetical protein
MDLLLSPASKVLNNWFEVVIIIHISFQYFPLNLSILIFKIHCFHLYRNSKVKFKFTLLTSLSLGI